MALINCPICGEEISDTAYYCVHCGVTLKKQVNNPIPRGRSSPKWLVYIVSAALVPIIVLAILVIANNVCIHEYGPATCIAPATCVKCGKTKGELIDHKWTLGLDAISCSYCKKELIETADVKNKAGEELSSAAKALIYYNLDYYFTETDRHGKYLNSEEQVYSYIQNKFDVTRKYIDNNIWNGYAYNDYSQYRLPASAQTKPKTTPKINSTPKPTSTPKTSSSYGSSSSTTYRTEDRKRDAWVCAIGYVQDNLKSPSTAKFCKYTEATVMRVGEDEYIIHGYVDAQNSFGATVRQVWTVSLFLTEKGFRDPYLEWG